jgi:hypothetical protein
MGCLRPGCSSTCRWIIGNDVASINVRAEPERVHLSYTVRVGDGESEDMAETIPIIHLRCRFGGSRAYFICPGPRDGTDCGRRITKLHLSRRLAAQSSRNSQRTASKDIQTAARLLGLRLHVVRGSTDSDFDTVFATLIQLPAAGLVPSRQTTFP